MTKITCDVCGGEIQGKGHKRIIATHFASQVWQEEEIDICDKCLSKLVDLIGTLESQFFNQHGKIDSINFN